MDQQMHMGEVSRLLRVSPDWIRRAERTGAFPPAARDAAGRRVWDADTVARLAAARARVQEARDDLRALATAGTDA